MNIKFLKLLLLFLLFPILSIAQTTANTNCTTLGTIWSPAANKCITSMQSLGYTPLNPNNNLSDVNNRNTALSNLFLYAYNCSTPNTVWSPANKACIQANEGGESGTINGTAGMIPVFINTNTLGNSYIDQSITDTNSVTIGGLQFSLNIDSYSCNGNTCILMSANNLTPGQSVWLGENFTDSCLLNAGYNNVINATSSSFTIDETQTSCTGTVTTNTGGTVYYSMANFDVSAANDISLTSFTGFELVDNGYCYHSGSVSLKKGALLPISQCGITITESGNTPIEIENSDTSGTTTDISVDIAGGGYISLQTNTGGINIDSTSGNISLAGNNVTVYGNNGLFIGGHSGVGIPGAIQLLGEITGTYTPPAPPAGVVQISAGNMGSRAGYNISLPLAQGTGTLTNDGAGNLSWNSPTGITLPYIIYSKTGTVLSSCSSSIVGGEATVSDATSLIPGSVYEPSASSPGANTIKVQCTLSGTTYVWQII
jgi:hypothetical protein